jgi:hypothetical protein
MNLVEVDTSVGVEWWQEIGSDKGHLVEQVLGKGRRNRTWARDFVEDRLAEAAVLSVRTDSDSEMEGQDKVFGLGLVVVVVAHMDLLVSGQDIRLRGSFDFDSTHWPYSHP